MSKKFKKIYCDFDGTIAKKDSVNDFLRLFAPPEWLEIEELWVEGKVSSQICLKKQTELLPEMDEETLNGYLGSIELSEGFLEFYAWAKQSGVEIVILSDGFDLFIRETLERHGISDIKYFANTLVYENKRFDVEFCHNNPQCARKSGTCKCSKIEEEDFCYIGDGVSDFCVAKKAKKVFAKSNLKKYCEKTGVQYCDFVDFMDVLRAFAMEEEHATN